MEHWFLFLFCFVVLRDFSEFVSFMLLPTPSPHVVKLIVSLFGRTTKMSYISIDLRKVGYLTS